jgi:hypothetical protein
MSTDSLTYIHNLRTGTHIDDGGSNNSSSVFNVTGIIPTSVITPNIDVSNYDVESTSFVVGSTQLNYIDADRANRMMFDKKKGSFNAGSASGTHWNTANRGDYSVAMGQNCTASGLNSTAIGLSCTASGNSSTSIGDLNNASGNYSVAMGYNSFATNPYSVSIGRENTSSGIHAVAIGTLCTASGTNSSAIGGNNTSSGNYSVAIGRLNTSGSPNSMALGNGAKIGTDKNGSFVWRSSLSTDEATEHGKAGSAHFICGPAVGSEFRISFGSVSTAAATSGATGYAWANSSDINLKENLVEHNYSDTLDRIMVMPIYTYNFKSVASGIKSIGPVAQDFNRLFPSDKDPLSIVDRDMCGVALAGIRGINEKLNAALDRISALETELAALKT